MEASLAAQPDGIADGPVLLTGGTGFVGRHVATVLRDRGLRLRCLVRSPSRASHLAAAGDELFEADLSRAARLRAACVGVRAVVHVAGLVKARSADELHAVNAGGAARLAEAWRAVGPDDGRFLLVSSQAAAGPSPSGRRSREEDPERPVSDYGRSKLAGEREVRRVLAGRPWTIVRPPTVYGPHDTDVFEFFAAAHRGLRLRIGTRERRASIVHVEDLARGVADALAAPAAVGRTYFLANETTLSIDDLLGAIATAVGRARLPVRVPEPILRAAGVVVEEVARLRGVVPDFSRDKAREFLARSWDCDPRRAREELGWEARVELARGLAETAAWYEREGWFA